MCVGWRWRIHVQVSALESTLMRCRRGDLLWRDWLWMLSVCVAPTTATSDGVVVVQRGPALTHPAVRHVFGAAKSMQTTLI
jgi:hypothetical protein